MIITWRTGADGDHQIWAHLEPGDPTEMRESFIVASGPTLAEAALSAVDDLHGAIKSVFAIASRERREGQLDHGKRSGV